MPLNSVSERTFCLLHATTVFFILASAFFFSCNTGTTPAPPPIVADTVPPSPPVPEVKDSARGLASFYGRAFDGEKTASGSIFDSRELVAAHPKYPFGTIVRVTNLRNQDTVTVEIVDRGPTHINRKEGVIIDLSRGAAEKIKMIGAGRQRVKVEVLEWGEG